MAVIQPLSAPTLGTMAPLTTAPTSLSPYNLTAPSVSGANQGGKTTIANSGPNGPFAQLGPQMMTSAQNSLNAGNNILSQEGLGQTALYNQTENQQQQASAQAAAAAGLGNSPWGASVAANNMTNFNNNWNNNQLARYESALGAQEGSMGNANTLYNFSNQTSTQNVGAPTPAPAAPASTGTAQPFTPIGGTTSQVPQSPFGSPQSSAAGSGISGQTTPSQIPGYGQPTDTSSVVNQTGVDNQSILNPTEQQQQSPYGVMNQITGASPQAVSDANGTSTVGDTGLTAQQLLNPNYYNPSTSQFNVDNPNSAVSQSATTDWSTYTGAATPSTLLQAAPQIISTYDSSQDDGSGMSDLTGYDDSGD